MVEPIHTSYELQTRGLNTLEVLHKGYRGILEHMMGKST